MFLQSISSTVAGFITVGLLATSALADVKIRDVNQILIGDSKRIYQFSPRNVRKRDVSKFVNVDGRDAIGITLRYADKGHKNDWVRAGKVGTAQRYEIAEKKSKWMKAGNVYWQRMSVYIPRGTRVLELAHLTDLKVRSKDDIRHNPVISISLDKSHLRVRHLVGRPMDCVTGLEKGGGTNGYCNHDTEFVRLVPTSKITGRWVELVYRTDWQDGASGRFHMWIDGELKLGLSGVTAHDGKSIESKFGLYRLWFKQRGTPAPDLTVYFTDVGRGKTCDKIALENCEAFEADTQRLGYFGVGNRWTTREREKDKWLASGRPILRK